MNIVAVKIKAIHATTRYICVCICENSHKRTKMYTLYHTRNTVITRLLFAVNRPPATISTQTQTYTHRKAKWWEMRGRVEWIAQMLNNWSIFHTQMVVRILLVNNDIINFSELSYCWCMCVCPMKCYTMLKSENKTIRTGIHYGPFQYFSHISCGTFSIMQQLRSFSFFLQQG